jgi:hypothetical protein
VSLFLTESSSEMESCAVVRRRHAAILLTSAGPLFFGRGQMGWLHSIIHRLNRPTNGVHFNPKCVRGIAVYAKPIRSQIGGVFGNGLTCIGVYARVDFRHETCCCTRRLPRSKAAKLRFGSGIMSSLK